MNTLKTPIQPCLWFDKQGDEAANFYVSVFPDSKIVAKTYYPKEGVEVHKQEEGSVLTVLFDINNQRFLALNAGPAFTFNEAVSFQILCETQEEIDYYWEKLTEGGSEGECGWLKDKFGVSWQVAPAMMEELLQDPETRGPVMKAFMQMKKFDIATIKKAAGK